MACEQDNSVWAGLGHTLQDVFHPHLLEREWPWVSCPAPVHPSTAAHFQTVGRGGSTVSAKNQQGAPERGQCFTRVFERMEGGKILRHFQKNRRLLHMTRASPATLTPAGTQRPVLTWARPPAQAPPPPLPHSHCTHTRFHL